jgi:hypothetical protein
MLMQPCEYGGELARCAVWAIWGDLYSTRLDVTDEAQWASSAPAVARVVEPGVLQGVAAGDAHITVEFRGYQQTTKFHVLSEGPPWRVYAGEYHILVIDETGAALEGVLVAIIAGGNAGRVTVSDRNGRAIFVGDSICGPITVRGVKPGYREWVGSAIKCGRAGNGQWGSESVGPVLMIPLP